MHNAKKIEKIKNDDLDLFYVYFSVIHELQIFFYRKKLPKTHQKSFFRRFYQEP